MANYGLGYYGLHGLTGNNANLFMPSAAAANWNQQYEQNELALKRMRQNQADYDKMREMNQNTQRFFSTFFKNMRTAEQNGVNATDWMLEQGPQMESQIRQMVANGQIDDEQAAHMRETWHGSVLNRIADLKKMNRMEEAQRLGDKFGIASVNPMNVAMMNGSIDAINKAKVQMAGGSPWQYTEDGKNIIGPGGRLIPIEYAYQQLAAHPDPKAIYNVSASELTRERGFDDIARYKQLYGLVKDPNETTTETTPETPQEQKKEEPAKSAEQPTAVAVTDINKTDPGRISTMFRRMSGAYKDANGEWQYPNYDWNNDFFNRAMHATVENGAVLDPLGQYYLPNLSDRDKEVLNKVYEAYAERENLKKLANQFDVTDPRWASYSGGANKINQIIESLYKQHPEILATIMGNHEIMGSVGNGIPSDSFEKLKLLLGK